MNYFNGILRKDREMEYARRDQCTTRKMTPEEIAAFDSRKRRLTEEQTKDARLFQAECIQREFTKRCRKVKVTGHGKDL